MAEKIDICICVGTACYIMGASDLLTIKNYLSPEQLEAVNIRGAACLGLCHEKEGSPPFVRIDGKDYSKVGLSELKNIIADKIAERSAL